MGRSETVDCFELPLKNDNKSVLKSTRRGRVELSGSQRLTLFRYKRFHRGRFQFIAVFMAVSNDPGISFGETFSRVLDSLFGSLNAYIRRLTPSREF